MPDNNGNLYLYEAIELRDEYDHHIKLIEKVLGEGHDEREGFLRRGDDEEKQPASDFNKEALEDTLKSIQTKRVKLNQAVQTANFENKVDFEGEEITLAEALEVRKNLIADIEALSKRVVNSAYKRVIHKEERDIVREPVHSFNKSYEEYRNTLKKRRRLVTSIHVMNHTSTVKFKDEQ